MEPKFFRFASKEANKDQSLPLSPVVSETYRYFFSNALDYWFDLSVKLTWFLGIRPVVISLFSFKPASSPRTLIKDILTFPLQKIWLERR